MVLGDMNEMIGDRNQGMTRLCQEYHLQGAIHNIHGFGNRDFNTYARGTTCIKYIDG
jgi:hypothetical protein